MPRRSRRLPLILELRDKLGIEGLANLEAELVRDRPVPPRLIAALFRSPGRHLTPREREIMVLLTSSYSRKEMADELGVSVETVKSHLRHAYTKLGARRQIEAVNAFLEDEA